MQSLKRKNTKPELVVRQVLPRHRKAIFVHGCFWHWHGCPKGQLPNSRLDYWLPKLEGNVNRDRTKIEQLESLGWDVLVVWQCETRDLEELAVRLEAFVGKP